MIEIKEWKIRMTIEKREQNMYNFLLLQIQDCCNQQQLERFWIGEREYSNSIMESNEFQWKDERETFFIPLNNLVFSALSLQLNAMLKCVSFVLLHSDHSSKKFQEHFLSLPSRLF